MVKHSKLVTVGAKDMIKTATTLANTMKKMMMNEEKFL